LELDGQTVRVKGFRSEGDSEQLERQRAVREVVSSEQSES
jgi:hypothetical protein